MISSEPNFRKVSALFWKFPVSVPVLPSFLPANLGVTTVDELEKAIEDGRVAQLPRMGEKTAQNILHQIKAYRKKKSEQRIPLGDSLAGS